MTTVAGDRLTPEGVDFGMLTVAFDGHVLRPRPWTTMQSHWAADIARVVPPGPILELCCGAGHIGLLAAVISGRRLVQVDSDPSACRLAQLNAERAGVHDQVDVRCDDIASALRSSERFPLIIADPPYVPSAEVATFPDDPPSAIDGGQTGLDMIVRCLDVMRSDLLEDGVGLLQARGPSQLATIGPLAHARTLTVHAARVAGPDRAVGLLRRQRGRS